ncbi:Asparagine synthetase [Aphelenchoides besseyi]|nr:Asparagine synthetase [Aphelenchoides besseyi]KAI6199692.1 Asparagine synthetase [Aphelenchoides besseyi]
MLTRKQSLWPNGRSAAKFVRDVRASSWSLSQDRLTVLDDFFRVHKTALRAYDRVIIVICSDSSSQRPQSCVFWSSQTVGVAYQRKRHEPEFLRILGRGPDLTVAAELAEKVVLGFHRLAIVEPDNVPSAQPIVADNLSVVCNGEIYNHEQLKAQSPLDNGLVLNGGSDCAAIIHAFRTNNGDLRRTCAALDGVFAFAMCDANYLYVARDPIGVRPLFYGRQADGALVFGSEAKCVEKLVEHVEFFPPGCCATIPLAEVLRVLPLRIQPYYVLPSIPERHVRAFEAEHTLRRLLINAVQKRLMGNRQFGFMLSGGLDSSLIASIASKFLTDVKPIAFSVGFADSPDLECARRITKYLEIPHRVLTITTADCLRVIPEVVYALETFDPLLIRCGIAHYLLCDHISRTSDVKILLSGEGADELFGSYSYMQRAPNPAHLHREMLRRMKHLHQYDVLRCDRATSCHGLEIRVPFLDKKFIEFSARLPPAFKLAPGQMEKHLLRKAFDGWIPDEVLWRGKEGFSEALGQTDLGEILNTHVEMLITDEQMAQRAKLFPWNTPETKEEFWYRTLFESFYSTNKMDTVVHTKIYRTAAWQLDSEKENCKDDVMSLEAVRYRRRSTGSAKFSGVA